MWTKFNVLIKVIWPFLGVTLVLFLGPAMTRPLPIVQAATVIVMNNNDSGPGSLRQALADATPGDIITFAPQVSGTITLTSGEIAVSKSLTVAGPGKDNLTIGGNGLSRVVTITTNVNVILADVTIANGHITSGSMAYECGGGIYNNGTLALINSAVYSNTASGVFAFPGNGAGLCNYGVTMLTNSLVYSNTANGNGGGIFNSSTGTVIVNGSAVFGNAAGQGGGIYNAWNSSDLILTNSLVYDNHGDYGAGIANSGALTITDSSVYSNKGGSGAGINNAGGTVALMNSAVYSNVVNEPGTCDPYVGMYGGGIYIYDGHVTLTNARIYGNVATGGTCSGGGGLFATFHGTVTLTKSVVYSNTTAGYGGGIYGATSMIAVANTAIYSNTANQDGGGLFVYGGGLIITNTTISGNSASSGGGVSIPSTLDSPATVGILNNTTVANNSGGGIMAAPGTSVTVANTIVANNAVNNCDSALISDGYNLEGDSTCGFTAIGDLSNTNPLLGILTDNGGNTMTHALLPGSPAKDAANPATPGTANVACAITDQRSIARPQNGRCDIGAYEVIPTLAINYPGGQPGSFFALTGSNFPPNSTASIVVNGQTLTTALPVDSSGSLKFLLSTGEADAGHYFVTATVNPWATTSFILDPNLPLRPQDGSGPILDVPGAIAFTRFLHLPLVWR